MKNNGFTLIETLIYLALFAIVIGGGMVAAYQIIQSTSASASNIMVQEEANFLLGKITWALTGATSVSVLPSNALQVTKGVATHTFNLCESNFAMQTGSGKTCDDLPITLNSNNVAVSEVPGVPLFKKITTPDQPDAITVSFMLTSFQDGRQDTEHFSTTTYLHK